MKIGKPCATLEFQNPGILTILEYSEPSTYSEPSQRFKVEYFVRIVKAYKLCFQSALSQMFDRVLNMPISQ